MNRENLIWHRSRDTYMSKHHLVPKCLGGSKKSHNLLRLWRDKHDAWHRIFENQTISEIIPVLIHGRKNIGKWVGTSHWKLLFGDKNLIEVYLLLTKLQQIKLYIRENPD